MYTSSLRLNAQQTAVFLQLLEVLQVSQAAGHSRCYQRTMPIPGVVDTLTGVTLIADPTSDSE
jgi:hypothetical protein